MNPRLPGGGAGLTQQQIIAELIEHDDVMKLAKQIAERGFFPTEILTVVEENGHQVVVEGNRRLAALKALADPALAPEKYQKRLEALRQKVPREQLARVNIYTAPTRDSVVPMLLGRHTQEGVQSWSPAAQANFTVLLAEKGMSPEELSATYGLSAAELAQAKFRHGLYEMARSIDLPPDIKKKVDDLRQFPITTLERIVEMKDGQRFLGIQANRDTGIKGTIPKEEFLKGFRQVVTDVADGTLTSRNTNSASEVREHLSKYPPTKKPNTRLRGSFVPSDVIARPTEEDVPPILRPTGTLRRGPRPSTSVIPRELRCTITAPRVQDVYQELKRLRMDEHPNSSALLLRSLLELALSHYLGKRKEVQHIKAAIEEKQGKPLPKDFHPTLRQMLRRALDAETLLPELDAPQRRALKNMEAARDTPVTIDSLNAFVHNPWETPTERELRAFSGKLTPLLNILLNDH